MTWVYRWVDNDDNCWPETVRVEDVATGCWSTCSPTHPDFSNHDFDYFNQYRNLDYCNRGHDYNSWIIIIRIRIIQSMARIFGHEKDYCDCSKINCKQNHVMSKLLCSESEECDKSAVKVWGRRRKLERHLGRWKHLVRFPNSFESRGKMVGQPDQARWGVFHLSRQTGQVWPDLSSSSAVGCLENSTNHPVNKVDNKILWRQNMHLSFWRPRSSASRGLTSETCTYCWVGNCDWRYQ